MSRLLLAVFSALLFCSSAFAVEPEDIDPSDASKAYSKVKVAPEYTSFGDAGATYGIRFEGSIAMKQGKYMFLFEAPYLWTDYEDSDSESGLGDTRLRFFYLPYRNSEAFLQAFSVSLDAYAPTGDEGKGLGGGTWIWMPGLLFKLNFSKTFAAYVMPRYVFSSGESTASASSTVSGAITASPETEESDISAFQVEAPFTLKAPRWDMWFVANPMLTINPDAPEGDDDYSLSLRGIVGRKWGRYAGLLDGSTHVSGKKSEEWSLSAKLMYYF